MDNELAKALEALGFQPRDLRPETDQELEDLKLAAKRAYKKLAVKLHPDTNPDSKKNALFVLLGKALKYINGLAVVPPPERPSQGRGVARGVRVQAPAERQPRPPMTWQQVRTRQARQGNQHFNPGRAAKIRPK